ncbi:MAG: hypothetical protein OEM82_05010 [Acidobacteriota bacterium]|nr:hypothetical protein [Acidobacteriota bacterium]MDH3528888.1 hypothetical protein [Acidobacteriota bacterium]
MRKLIEDLESAFEHTHQKTIDLLGSHSFEDLFESQLDPEASSAGMILIRSASKVEQCFGGITSRLWDDPFEWTLPESFCGPNRVFEYLSEVKKARDDGFRFLTSDSDLAKLIPTPAGMQTVFSVLLQSLLEAERLLAIASAVSKTTDTNRGFPLTGSA